MVLDWCHSLFVFKRPPSALRNMMTTPIAQLPSSSANEPALVAPVVNGVRSQRSTRSDRGELRDWRVHFSARHWYPSGKLRSALANEYLRSHACSLLEFGHPSLQNGVRGMGLFLFLRCDFSTYHNRVRVCEQACFDLLSVQPAQV